MQPTLLNNITCIYCGCELNRDSRTKEHVIGRRFVPKGMLANSWNLIAWACHECNNKKSSLEDDISAITMQPDAWGKVPESHATLTMEAQRKANNSFSKKTGKRVADSHETVNLKLNLGTGITMAMNFVAPPQHIPARLHALARYHLLGFFYLLTYNKTTNRGKFPTGSIFILNEAIRSNWGNAAHLMFMRNVISWDERLIAPGLANGFFRVAIRRRTDANCFSWALEWNKNLRLIGFFGNEADAKPEFDLIPDVIPSIQYGDRSRGISMVPDTALSESNDVLFAIDEARATEENRTSPDWPFA
jgi:hypothetical protein